MEFLYIHSGTIVTLCFFVAFIGIAAWAYLPSNKRRLQNYANIPLEGEDDGR